MAQVLLVSGSLRSRSTNTAVLRTVRAVAPPGVEGLLYPGLGLLPHFNPDDDVDPLPPAAAELRARIRAAHALVFSVPEYAGALPGSFKNLLDWTIGDDQPGSIYRKPVGWINVSPCGAASAHEELRRVLDYAHARIIDQACVHVPVTGGMVGENGLVAGSVVRDRITDVLNALAAGVEAGEVG
jgi:NAD(P)H-dependent FMN reductase